MQPHHRIEKTGKIILDGLQGINMYLIMINSQFEMLLCSDLPEDVKEDVKSNLVKMVQTTLEAIQILRILSLFYHKQL